MALDIQTLETTNQFYKDNINDWDLYRLSYLGGSDYIGIGGNLFRHGREAKTDFDRRLQRAYFENFCAPAISLYAGFLSSAPVKRNIKEAAAFAQFMNDATIQGQRMSYRAFISEMIIWAATQGVSVAVVDRPTSQTLIKTKADEQAAGIRTFVRRIPIENLLDWSMDGNGNFRWVKIKEDCEDNRQTFDEKPNEKKIYRVITATDWTKYSVKTGAAPVVEETGTHRLGKVPVVLMYWPGGSLIKDAALINRAVFNHCSLLDEILYRLTFPMLLTPGGKSGAPAPELKIGTMDSLTFDPDNPAAKPEFIAAPSAPAEVLMKQIENGIQAINRALLYRGTVDSIAEQSGIAKAYDFSQLNNVLLHASTSIAVAEEGILNLFQDWESPNHEPTSVEYPNDFDLQSLTALVDNAIKLGTLRLGVEFERYTKKKIAHTFVDQRDRETLGLIEAEIDSGATDLKELPPIMEFGKPAEEPEEQAEA